MISIYVDHKRKPNVGNCVEYLVVAKGKYRNIYRKQKWKASKFNQSSGFYG